MPDKPAIDHRLLGRIRMSLADVSPRVVEDVTTKIEAIRFRDRGSGDIFEFVVAETHATTRAADRPGAEGKPTVEDYVFDVLCESLGAADPALMRDVARTGDGLSFVESATGKAFGVTLEKVGQKYAAGPAKGQPQAEPAAPERKPPPPPPPPPAPMAPQATPGTSPV